MIVRSHDLEELVDAVTPYSKLLLGFNPEEWLATDWNIMLSDGKGNVTLWDKNPDGVYTAHIFFVIKGRAAKKLALEMIGKFWEITGEQVVRGMTPLENRAARWMARQLGFKSYGAYKTIFGPCELFILTKNGDN